MRFNEDRFERYAVQTELESQKTDAFANPAGGVNINAVGAALGYGPEESQQLAWFMNQEGWVNITSSDPPTMTLTARGYREIAKLRWPKWRRWIDQHPLIMSVIWMLLTGVVSG